MRKTLFNIPDWVGTAIVGILASVITGAFMWGSLKSEVSAQVTAQSVDASDIKQLISGQAQIGEAVKALTIGQEQLHQDFLSLMDRHGVGRDNSSTSSSATR